MYVSHDLYRADCDWMDDDDNTHYATQIWKTKYQIPNLNDFLTPAIS